MAEIVRMPKLSDTMTEGVVAEWHKKVGDNVSSGDLLAEIETDKATMEFEAFQEGVLLHIGVEKGKATKVDGILAILGQKGEDITALLKEDAAAVSTPKVEEKKSTPTPTPTPTPVATPKIEEKKVAVVQSAPVAYPTASDMNTGRLKASPLAKKLAEDKGVNLSRIKGTGEGGRVVK